MQDMIRRSGSRVNYSLYSLRSQRSSRHEVQYIVCIIEPRDYRLYLAQQSAQRRRK